MRFTENSISKTEEKLLVTGLVVSTEFCKRIKEYIDLEYITNSYLRKLAEWSLVFYEEHQKAPFKHINDIFESHRPTMKEADAELIDDLLTNLGNQFDPDAINVDYLVSEGENFFRRRELEIHVNNISALKDTGDYTSAEEEISRFNRVSIKLDENIYINPGDEATRERIYRKRYQQKKEFFKLPGDLGHFIGNWCPGDVVGITAPAKSGKSFFLTDIQKHAVLQNIQILKFSVEMTDDQELERHDKSFFPSVHKAGYHVFPVFDCVKNQMGDCGDRLSPVIIKESVKDQAVPNPSHIPCTKCRTDRKEWERFKPTSYKMEIWREENNLPTVRKAMRKWNQLLKKYSRMVVRPKYSLTYDLMMRDIDIMVSKWNFIPKIIALDYVDILAMNTGFDDYRMVDEQWKMLQRVAGQTKCLIITPTQANKEGAEAETLKSTHQSGFYGKGRHVNMMIGINQTGVEKRNGIYRMNVLDSRSSYQDPSDSCIVLQDLGAGQMHLDSVWQRKFEVLRYL
jgi:hypothetical protein